MKLSIWFWVGLSLAATGLYQLISNMIHYWSLLCEAFYCNATFWIAMVLVYAGVALMQFLGTKKPRSV